MQRKPLFRVMIALICLSMLITGCGTATAGGVEVWIDAPLPGGRVQPGEEVRIQTHAYARSGVAEIKLDIDGNPYSQDVPAPAGSDLVTLEQFWLATSPGMHTLMVTAYDSGGRMSNPRSVVIEVLPPTTATPEATMTPSSPPEPTITDTSIPPTSTATSVPEPIMNFNVDDDSITAGECTHLRWDVKFAETVTLNDSPVGSLDARQVCPEQDTSYTLRAVSAGGEENETILIKVSSPPVQDTTGPVISKIKAEPATIYDSATCGADRTKIRATVEDASSGVKRVDIFYQAVTSSTGQWKSLKMSGNEKDGFSIYLGKAELVQSLALYGGGTVRYYLVAEDNAGNKTTSKTFTFKVEVCLI